MAINSDHLIGVAVGLGAAAGGYYLYRKNQSSVDAWLRRQGIHLPADAGKDYSSATLEELTLEKERLEDLIAERELAEAQAAAAEGTEAPA